MATKGPDVRVRLSAEGEQQVINAFKRISREMEQTKRSAGGFNTLSSSIGSATTALKGFLAAAGIAFITKQIYDAVAAGIKFNATLEASTLGIAAIINAQALLVNTQGKVLTGTESFAAALQMAREVMRALQIDALKTAATTAELVVAFQAGLSSALGAGITDLNQVREIVIGITRAALAMGLPVHQLRQEVTSILQGNIVNQSVVAKNLGITNADIERWKEAGTLVSELQKRLEPFGLAASEASSSWNILISNIGEAFQKFAGESTKGLFERLKTTFGNIFEGLFDDQVRIAEKFRPIVDAVNSVSTLIGDILGRGLEFAIGAAEQLAGWFKENEAVVRETVSAFGLVAKEVGGLLVDGLKIVAFTIKWLVQTRTLQGVLGGISFVIAAIRDGVRLLGGAIAFVGASVAEVLVTPLDAALRGLAAAANFVKEGWGDSLSAASLVMNNMIKSAKSFGKETVSNILSGKGAVGDLITEIERLNNVSGKATPVTEESTGSRISGLRNKQEKEANENALKELERYHEARRRLAAAQLEAELAILKAGMKNQTEAEKDRYEQGLVDIDTYFKNRAARINQAIDAEIATMRSAKLALILELGRLNQAPLGKKESTTERETSRLAVLEKIAKLNGEIQVKEVERTGQLADLTREQTKAVVDSAREKLTWEQRLAELQNRRFDAERIALQQEVEGIQRLKGETDAAFASRKQIVLDVGLKDIDFRGLQASADNALNQLGAERQKIFDAVSTGQIFEFQGEERLRRLELDRIPILRQIAEEMHKAAITPEQIQQAQDFAASVREIEVATDIAGQRMAEFKANVTSALAGDFTNFLANLGHEAQTVGELFLGLAESVVTSLQRIAAEMIATALVRKLLGAILPDAGQGGGAQQVASAAAAGAAQAAPLIAAGATLTAAGTALTAGGAVLTTGSGLLTAASTSLGAGAGTLLGGASLTLAAAAALQAAASTLLVANSIGAASPGFSTGGLVRGGGTGTSDSIPARLSNWEFVIKSSVVRKPGMLQHLRDLNEGGAPIMRRGTAHFAEGGLVDFGDAPVNGRARSGGFEAKLGLEDGLVLKELKRDPSALDRILVERLGSNPRRFKASLGLE
jgi:hypothetical protein